MTKNPVESSAVEFGFCFLHRLFPSFVSVSLFLFQGTSQAFIVSGAACLATYKIYFRSHFVKLLGHHRACLSEISQYVLIGFPRSLSIFLSAAFTLLLLCGILVNSICTNVSASITTRLKDSIEYYLANVKTFNSHSNGNPQGGPTS